MDYITAASQIPTSTLLIYLPAFVLLIYLLKTLLTILITNLTTDITKIPEPYIPPYQRYTIGHDLITQLVFTDPLTAQRLYNRWRREHGEIFQIRSLLGDRNISIMSSNALREVTITNHKAFCKTAATRAAVGSLVGQKGLFLAEGPAHARLRSAVAPAMHHEALIALGHIFLRQGALLAERLAMGELDDVLREVRLRTFDVIFETCFGEGATSEEEVERIREAYLAVFKEPPVRAFVRILLTKLLWFVDSGRFQYRRDLKTFLRERVYELCRRKVTGGKKTLLKLMVDAETRKKLRYREMVDTVLSFLVAGQITTSLSVCWTLYLLARHPGWQDRLYKELGEWSEEDGLEPLDKLPLLNRIIRESLRLYPPVFLISRATNQAVTLDGYHLPKGTTIRIPVLALQRCEDVWGSDVDEFNPDRYLNNGYMARTNMFWCGFLFGPRGCIGQRFALLEIKAFVTQILKRQRVYVKPLQDPPPRIVGPLVSPRDMKLYFESRADDA